MRSTRNHHVLPRLGTGRPCSSLFDLAPGGVYLAQGLSTLHGGLLHRRFTLTSETPCGSPKAVWFLWHFPFPSFTKGIPHRSQHGHPALWSPDFPLAGLLAQPVSDQRPELRLSKI